MPKSHDITRSRVIRRCEHTGADLEQFMELFDQWTDTIDDPWHVTERALTYDARALAAEIEAYAAARRRAAMRHRASCTCIGCETRRHEADHNAARHRLAG